MTPVNLYPYEYPVPQIEMIHGTPQMVYKAGINASCGCEVLYGYLLPDGPEGAVNFLIAQSLDEGVLVKACSQHHGVAMRVSELMRERHPEGCPSLQRVMALFAEVLAGL